MDIETKPRIVCAACKHTDGRIVCGPRHFDETMWKQILNVPVLDYRELNTVEVTWSNAEQGFINQFGTFYTREQAWVIALDNGQIIRYNDWQTGTLHSEHLY